MPHDLKADHLRGLPPQERLIFLKSNLKDWHGKLHTRHLSGEAGLAHAQANSEAIDHLLRTLLLSLLKEGEELDTLALVANGGYGRGIMNPGSDVDLLFLSSVPSSKVSKRVSEIICELQNTVWDLGFKFLPSTRSITECLKEAKLEPQSLSLIHI